MKFEHLQRLDLATEYLADCLIDGTLVLFLGAGASKGFGLPSWIELANAFIGKADPSQPPLLSDSNSERIEDALDAALRKINNDTSLKIRYVKDILYPDPASLISRSAFSQELLIALSALLIGRKRGHITRVVTFNYDSMLEWFLNLFGFQARPIFSLPSLEGSEDVRVYHPHGYIPHPSMGRVGSDFLILGSMDANLRAADEKDPWWAKERDLLVTSVGLYIGLSFNTFKDRAFQPHLLIASKSISNDRPLGLWVFLEALTDSQIEQCLSYNIVPLRLESPDEITGLILKVSQRALEKILRV